MHATTLTLDVQNTLAQAVQARVPFVQAPFAQMAKGLGLSEAQALEQLQAWCDEGSLREISAIVEGSATDYESALVAGRVPADGLERAVTAVNAHPTVTHNYLREHAYNLWFTIAVPARMGLARTLGILAREAGVEAWHPLRRERTFKIGVSYDLATRRNARTAGAVQAGAPGEGSAHGRGHGRGHRSAQEHGRGMAGVALSADERVLVRTLQSPLPLTGEPFAALAQAAGVPAAELLAFGERHLGGLIRRYAGTFNHRKLGIDGNGMVHTADRETCRALAAALAQAVSVDDYAVLFSTREFKKERLRYFLPDLEQWWIRHAEKECEA
jgi:DNA-binding Lrp family transcriptional regulator